MPNIHAHATYGIVCHLSVHESFSLYGTSHLTPSAQTHIGRFIVSAESSDTALVASRALLSRYWSGLDNGKNHFEPPAAWIAPVAGGVRASESEAQRLARIGERP